MNTILSNDLLNNSLHYLIPCTICLISWCFLIYRYYPTDVQTPNSPPTFNLNHDQIIEINEILDRGEELDKEIKDQLDQDFKNILGEQDYNDFNQEILELQDQFSQQLQDIFTKLF